jgi:hypothetical protein
LECVCAGRGRVLSHAWSRSMLTPNAQAQLRAVY